MTVAVGHSQRPRKRLSLLNAPFCTLMASLAANCFIWQQIDRGRQITHHQLCGSRENKMRG